MAEASLLLRIKAAVDGASSVEELRAELNKLLIEANKPAPDPTANIGDNAPQATQSIRELGESARSSTGLLSGMRGALAGLGIAGLTAQFVSAADGLTRLESGLKAVFGSSEAAGRELDFVREVANKLGLELNATAQAYLSLTASAKGTALEGQATREIFDSVSSAMATLGKSSADTELALQAIAQMMSKGTVSSEELKGQLGEQLPGAFQAAAKAIGVTTAELGKLLESGSITAADLLPKLAAELNNTFGNTAPINTFGATTARVLNQVNGLLANIANSGVTSFSTSVISSFGKVVEALNVVPIAVDGVGRSIGAGAAAFSQSGFSGAVTAVGEESANAAQKLADLGLSLLGVATPAEHAASMTKKLADETEKAVTPLEKLQDAAARGNFKKLSDDLQAAIELTKKTGDEASGAEKALTKFMQAPGQLADASRVLELAETIELIGRQADNSGEKLRSGIGAALESLTGDQLLKLQTTAQVALDSAVNGSDNAKQAFLGLGDTINGVAIAAFNRLGIDGVEALTGLDNKFREVAAALRVLTENAETTATALNQAFAAAIDTASTVQELGAVREALVKAGEAGKLSGEQVSLALISIQEKASGLIAALDPTIQALERLGIDGTEALTGMDSAMRANIETLKLLAADAKITGDVLYRAIGQALQSANTQAELDALRVTIQQFGAEGRLSGDQVRQALSQLAVQVVTAREEVSTLGGAYRTLGVESTASLKALAENATTAFQQIKQSGTATPGEITAAFAAMAQAVVNAGASAGPVGEAMALASVRAKAATQEQIAIVDQLEKKLRDAGTTAEETGQKQADSAEQATAAIQEQAAALAVAERSMIGVSVATAEFSGQTAAAFGEQGIQRYQQILAQVADATSRTADQAARLAAALDSGSPADLARDLSAAESWARELASQIGDGGEGMEELVRQSEQLDDAIKNARDQMAQFTEKQAEALKDEQFSLRQLQADGDALAQLQLKHERDRSELLDEIATAERQNNSEALDFLRQRLAILDQTFRIERDRQAVSERETQRISVTTAATEALQDLDSISLSGIQGALRTVIGLLNQMGNVAQQARNQIAALDRPGNGAPFNQPSNTPTSLESLLASLNTQQARI